MEIIVVSQRLSQIHGYNQCNSRICRHFRLQIHIDILHIHGVPEFLPPILGSYLCLYIWEKINIFHYIWENIYKIWENKANFGLGMVPVTGGKTGQIK